MGTCVVLVCCNSVCSDRPSGSTDSSLLDYKHQCSCQWQFMQGLLHKASYLALMVWWHTNSLLLVHQSFEISTSAQYNGGEFNFVIHKLEILSTKKVDFRKSVLDQISGFSRVTGKLSLGRVVTASFLTLSLSDVSTVNLIYLHNWNGLEAGIWISKDVDKWNQN